MSRVLPFIFVSLGLVATAVFQAQIGFGFSVTTATSDAAPEQSQPIVYSVPR